MDGLERALQANRAEVQRQLIGAEAELDSLRERERSLEKLIHRARLVLEDDRAQSAESPREGLLLHDALVRILRERQNSPMTARELADEVNRSALYRKRDGSPVEAGQIHARVHNYDRLFLREAGRIRLRDPRPTRFDPSLIARFDESMQEVYDSAFREVRYSARRFLDMLRRRGGLDAAKHLLAKSGESEGFRRLAEARKLDLTLEYQVLRPEFAELFSDEERNIARDRLLSHGMTPGELPQPRDPQ